MTLTTLRASLVATSLLTALASTGCDVEDVGDTEPSVGEPASAADDSLGVAEQPFAAWGWYPNRQVYNGDYNERLGLDTGTAAFVSGIAGNLNGGGATVSTDLGPNASEMHLLMWAGTNHKLRADFGIVANATMEYGRAFSTQSGTRSERLVSSGSPRRRCFITYICGGGTQFFNSADDAIAIEKRAPDNAWYLTMRGSACGAASCTLVDQPDWWAANSEGVWPLGDEAPGKMCWLTGVQGRFRDDNDMENGVFVRTRAGKWELVVGPGKWGGAECNF